MGISEILEMMQSVGLQSALLILFVAYFLKRDKDREDSLVDEKCKNREAEKNQKPRTARTF